MSLDHRYVEAEQPLRQDAFGQQLLTHVPLAAHIRKQLEEESSGTSPEKPFLELLEQFLPGEEAKRVLEVAVEWGRYGEVYEYDFHTSRLKLPDQEEE
jgi:NitT/TauT family transport system ATP-binding protein